MTVLKKENQVVVITGASSGIGEALVRIFYQKGARVVLSARRLERLNGIIQDLESQTPEGSHDRLYAVQCDVTQKEDVNTLMSMTLEKWGQVNCVIANAGFGVSGSFARLSTDDYQRQFDTNIFGVMHLLKASYPALKESCGSAVIIGSVNSYVSLANNSPYAMSKFALRALAYSLDLEWRKEGIAVTLINPGFVSSEIRQVNNYGVYKEHAKDPVPAWLVMPTDTASKQIYKAIQKRRFEVIITQHGKVIVALMRFMPWLVRFLLGRSALKAKKKTTGS
jgi:short-subunit dehydrogenase